MKKTKYHDTEMESDQLKEIKEDCRWMTVNKKV